MITLSSLYNFISLFNIMIKPNDELSLFVKNFNSSPRITLNTDRKKLTKMPFNIRTSTSNIYNKTSLGTIPSPIMTLFYYDPKIVKHIGFNSQCERFPTEPNEPYIMNTENTASSLNNNISKYAFSNQTLRTVFKKKHYNIQINKESLRTKDSIFDQVNYNPGPGHYNQNDDVLKQNLRYKSLFNSTETKPLRHKCLNANNTNLGPGTYDIRTRTQKRKFFISKLPRFTNLKITTDVNLGPGKYQIENSNNKKKEKQSYFFMQSQDEIKPNDLIKKYLRTEENMINRHNVFKRKLINKERIFPHNNKSKDISMIKEEILNSINPKKMLKKSTLTSIQNESIDNERNNCCPPFDSGVERFKSKKRMINPGPCYYDPDIFSIERKYERSNNVKKKI